MVAASRAGLVALVGWLAAGCGESHHAVEICGRGDRADLAAALRGGALELSFRDEAGAELGRATASAERPTELVLAVPAGATTVAVIGRGATGDEVARGVGAVRGGEACVCFALTAEVDTVCAGVGCTASAGTCAFTGPDGAALGSQTLVVGDDGDLVGKTRDTSLLERTPDASYGGGRTIVVAGDPPATGLLRFDLGGFARASVIERAVLELAPCTGCVSTGAIAVYRVLEPWDEGQGTGTAGCASWNCRRDGVAWSVPGCGFLSDLNRAREPAAIATAGLTGGAVSIDVTAAVAGWLAQPATNFGLALVADDGGTVGFASREAASQRPRLRVTFHLDDSGAMADAGPPGPPDAGAGDGGALEMVPVAAGGFLMGCDPTAASCEADELPLHAVTLAAYEIDRTEVTQAAWAACITGGGCAVPICDYDPVARASYPVTCVTYAQAKSYCQWLGKRLPSEAEWEKAARGEGGQSYPWGEAPPTCALANGFGCAGATQPVGIHPAGASPYGAVDLGGNAAEWVNDFYQATYYGSSPTSDPTGPTTGTHRVRRGGAYSASAAGLAAYDRVSIAPTAAKPYLGFRCAR